MTADFARYRRRLALIGRRILTRGRVELLNANRYFASRKDRLTFTAREVWSRLRGRRRLHVAIKISAPDDWTGDVWGDVFFANDLAAAIRRQGHDAHVDRLNARIRPFRSYSDDVVIHLRGLVSTPPVPGAVNVLWIISHPDIVTVEEIESGYDVVYAASLKWAAEMSQVSAVPVTALLQATDPGQFHPATPGADLSSDVLFVGKSRLIFRPIVRDALAVGADLTVYGDNWGPFIPDRYVKAEFLERSLVADAYRSARIVLNDHWEDMRIDGFLSNRLFDAAACGALVVTDDAAGIRDVFGDTVAVYSTPDELQALLDASHLWPSPDERVAEGRRIGQLHSFESRARTILADASLVNRRKI